MSGSAREPSGRRGGAGWLSRSPKEPARWLIAASAAAGLLVFAFVAYADIIRGDGLWRGPALHATSGDVRLHLGGRVGGLYPGRAKRLHVHVDNRGTRVLLLRSVEAVVGRAGSGCAARHVAVKAYRGELRVPPHARRWVALRISMRAGAANRCQGAIFPLTFRAKASP